MSKARIARSRTAIEAATNARIAVDQVTGLVQGRLAVGMVHGCALPPLADLLARFHQRYPGVTIALRTGLIADLLADLDAGRIDVALCPVHDDLPAAYLARPLAAESVVLATPPGRHSFPGGVARLGRVCGDGNARRAGHATASQ